ncbi:hypothetical protein KFL_004340050 [Klebsormidium nitens]|uniref:ATPase n=1 Tax=Klebsormidium nitens TaxID=105231 RepID=A0A1Y1IK28_KLENI|nr:hypothetical protein KFL_004340050 [Klebsormidium nitens]|eukprot:GAQ88498.1 hypothetical protein KFL_004340050 [Klebsormidium nitens]
MSGRGAYYKAKYGGGRGRGRGRSDEGAADYIGGQSQTDNAGGWEERSGSYQGNASGSVADLMQTLQRIDGKGYGAYKDIVGRWEFPEFTLLVDHAQADPFAGPSRCRVQVKQALARFPPELFSTRIRNIALCDYLTRNFSAVVSDAGADIRKQSGGGWGAAKGGEMAIDVPGQKVLERTSILINPQNVEARFTVALPAQGRTVLGQWAAQVLTQQLPKFVREALFMDRQDEAGLRRHVETVEDTETLRQGLARGGFVAFVGDGSILPRKSGDSEEPMDAREAIPFKSPPSLAMKFTLPNRGPITGMAIKKGVTLIVGGGFHGKSTLLEAIEAGVYNHIPGDGRELVATDPTAVKVRAEDGRHVEGVDISPFISNLPFGRDTTCFRTPDASGSTSQATNIIEALEVGAKTLLVDEDTCATNFMIRDARMQALVAKEKEPITPFIAKIRPMVTQHDTSVILVMGGSGDYFDVADTVVMMESFAPRDVTSEAKAIAADFGGAPGVPPENGNAPFGRLVSRFPVDIYPLSGGGHRDIKIVARTKNVISFGDQEIDLAAVEQLAEKSQTRAVADAIALFRRLPVDGRQSIQQLLASFEREVHSKGLDVLAPHMHLGTYARPRVFEIAAALNRLRTIKVQQHR